MVNCVGIIQARIGSKRLSGKVLAPLISTESVLSTLIKRVENSDMDWWVATTENQHDDVIEYWARYLGLNVFRGSEIDVLSRFTSIARQVNTDWIVRVTADDPFMSSNEIRILTKMAECAKDTTALICDNPNSRVYPLGYCPEIVRSEALFYAEKTISAEENFHRSHVTSFLRPFSEFVQLERTLRHPEYRWTIDTIEDLQFAQKIFGKLSSNYILAGYTDFLEICKSNPSLVLINSNIKQKNLKDG